jgi:hypothetical protein
MGGHLGGWRSGCSAPPWIWLSVASFTWLRGWSFGPKVAEHLVKGRYQRTRRGVRVWSGGRGCSVKRGGMTKPAVAGTA